MRELTIEEARKYLQIDKYALDEACTNQADLFFNISEKAVLASSEKDLAKENLAVVGAEVAATIRQEANDKGEKITEAKIQQLITTSEEHKQAHLEYVEAIKEAELWKVLRDGFLQRSSMIKALCELFLNNYYADITVKSSEVSAGDVGYGKHRARIADRKKKG
jgi:hypothetical protein